MADQESIKNGKDSTSTLGIIKPKPIALGENLRSQRNWNIERLDRSFNRLGSTNRFFDFLTTGTSNKRPDELVSILKKRIFSCNRVIDVRNNPNSRHTPAWNKKSVLELFGTSGIEYLHSRFGVPREIRQKLYSGEMSVRSVLLWYDANVLEVAKLDAVAEMVKGSMVVFLCTEVSPLYCHRHRIALRLESDFGYIKLRCVTIHGRKNGCVGNR